MCNHPLSPPQGDSSLYQRRCVVRLSGVDNNLGEWREGGREGGREVVLIEVVLILASLPLQLLIELVFELGITFKREVGLSAVMPTHHTQGQLSDAENWRDWGAELWVGLPAII